MCSLISVHHQYGSENIPPKRFMDNVNEQEYVSYNDYLIKRVSNDKISKNIPVFSWCFICQNTCINLNLNININKRSLQIRGNIQVIVHK
jgi:hypothetical protein